MSIKRTIQVVLAVGLLMLVTGNVSGARSAARKPILPLPGTGPRRPRANLARAPARDLL